MKLSDEELLEELDRRFKENKRVITELRDMTGELQKVNKKLEESEALKSHFISNITNEIVNPFTSILGLSKNITSIEKSDQIRQMAELIYSEAFSLDFQLKNIFAAAEIEAGELTLQLAKVDINQLVESVIEWYMQEAARKKLTIEFAERVAQEEDGQLYFKADHQKLNLVLSNLLSNAIKFSHVNGHIIIKTNVTDKVLSIKVQDFGVGISQENQDIIFDRFTRLDTGINSLNRGHGLGLSINKAIIDLYKGTIEIRSEIDKGAIFVVTIPEPETINEPQDFADDGTELFFSDNEIF